MTVNPSQGAHVLLDYVNANFEDEAAYRWLFSLMREAVRRVPQPKSTPTLLLLMAAPHHQALPLLC